MKIVMLGATGAVGTQVVLNLLRLAQVRKLNLLGRRHLKSLEGEVVDQRQIDIFEPGTYSHLLIGHQIAICTLGVGQPSKMGKEEFLKIDKQAVFDFALECKRAGIEHFELLASVGINSNSRSFYLRSKGELVEDIDALNFRRFSVFQPSMILTPQNRYGFMQGLTLKIWPLLNPLLVGGLTKYRGIKVELLGQAMALNILTEKLGFEQLNWSDFNEINSGRIVTP